MHLLGRVQLRLRQSTCSGSWGSRSHSHSHCAVGGNLGVRQHPVYCSVTCIFVHVRKITKGGVVLLESEQELTIDLVLSPVGDSSESHKGASTRHRVSVMGPFDRRITKGRRISVTALEGLKGVEFLCVFASPGVVRMTTEFFPDAPLVQVKQTKAGRREVNLTGPLRRLLTIARLDPTGNCSIAIDVWVEKRGRYVELKCVQRGKGRPI